MTPGQASCCPNPASHERTVQENVTTQVMTKAVTEEDAGKEVHDKKVTPSAG